MMFSDVFSNVLCFDGIDGTPIIFETDENLKHQKKLQHQTSIDSAPCSSLFFYIRKELSLFCILYMHIATCETTI